jgi:hypothetical protein
MVTSYDNHSLDIQSGRILATNGLIHQELSQSLLYSADWFTGFLDKKLN